MTYASLRVHYGAELYRTEEWEASKKTKRKAVAEPIVAIEGLWDDDDVYPIIVRCYRR
jgi:hypothetical protein